MIESLASLPLGEIPTVSGNGINPFEFPEEDFELYSVPAHETGAPEIVRGIDIGSNKQVVSEGMVLLCKINPRINRVWVVKAASKYRQIASTEWITFDRNDSVNPEYLAHFLRQTEVRDFLAANASGVGGSLMRVKASTLAHYSFRLFGREMQRRIVAKLEELLSDLDAGVAELKAAQKKLQQYRQSLLKAAVEGALTANWREAQRLHGTPTETGAQLIARILSERRARWEAKQLAKFKEQGKAPPKDWQKKYPEPVQPDTSDMPALPEGWSWASLDMLLEKVVDGAHHTPTYTDSGVPFISVKDIRDGQVHFDKCRLISTESHSELVKRCRPKKGDLLVTKSGTIGRTAIIQDDREFSLFVSVALLKPCSILVDMHWIELAFQGWLQTISISNDIKGTAVKNLHLEDFRELVLPVPSSQEQAEVLNEFSGAWDLGQDLARTIQFSQSRSTAQRQNILRAAFSGQLIPQAPEDEPVRELLERIQAARSAQLDGPKMSKNKKYAEA